MPDIANRPYATSFRSIEITCKRQAIGYAIGKKAGFKIKLINHPANYFDLFTNLLSDIILVDNAEPEVNFIHFFTRNMASYLPFYRA